MALGFVISINGVLVAGSLVGEISKGLGFAGSGSVASVNKGGLTGGVSGGLNSLANEGLW